MRDFVFGETAFRVDAISGDTQTVTEVVTIKGSVPIRRNANPNPNPKP